MLMLIIFTIIFLILIYLVVSPFIQTARERNLEKKKNRMHINKKK